MATPPSATALTQRRAALTQLNETVCALTLFLLLLLLLLLLLHM
jgi:hypothetical protein